MALKKPPLIEAWMSFRFEPAADAAPWTKVRYQVFLDALAETHPDVQEMTRRAIKVGRRRSGTPHIQGILEEVLAVRALTEDGFRAIHMTPNELMVNYLRGEAETYPGFLSLLDEAMAHCRKYIECYRPIGVIQVALHYVDLVEIPIPDSRILKCEEYFTLNLQAPEAVFGTFASFDIKAVVLTPGGSDPVELVFATAPVPPDSPFGRFRMEWHAAVRAEARMGEEEMRANLQFAHDRVERCFRHAFTPQGWALFEPVEP